MKKALTLLVLILACSGMAFASFHVENSNVVKNSNSVVVANSVSESAAVVAESAPASSTNAAGSDSTMAIILALVSVIILPFGLHNWYLGRTKQALWQTLLMFPGFILIIPALVSWVWQVVDLIKLLVKGSL